MLRKLALVWFPLHTPLPVRTTSSLTHGFRPTNLQVGLVLCVGRGSVAQLTVAIILSFAFFALQMKTW